MPYAADRKFSCIYHILFSDGRVYIGATNDFLIRRNKHVYDLRHRRHPNALLQGAWDELGEDHATIEPIVLCGEDQLVAEEQKHLDAVFAANIALNIGRDAECGTRGLVPSEETRRKISIAGKGKLRTDEVKLRISLGKRPQPHVLRNPDGHRVKIGNMRQWCRDNKMSRSCVMRVLRGERAAHKGWVAST